MSACLPCRVTCVGDSITLGGGTTDYATKSYPSVLQNLLGSDFEVGNFGVSGAHVGTYPMTTAYTDALAWAAHGGEVIYGLGTNNSPSTSWTPAQIESWIVSNVALINVFRDLGSRVWLNKPPSAVVSANLPTLHAHIAALALRANAPVIDIYAPFDGHPELFADGVHPNDAGAEIVAQIVHGVLAANPSECEEFELDGEALVDFDASKAVRADFDVRHFYVDPTALGSGELKAVCASWTNGSGAKRSRFVVVAKDADDATVSRNLETLMDRCRQSVEANQ